MDVEVVQNGSKSVTHCVKTGGGGLSKRHFVQIGGIEMQGDATNLGHVRRSRIEYSHDSFDIAREVPACIIVKRVRQIWERGREE